MAGGDHPAVLLRVRPGNTAARKSGSGADNGGVTTSPTERPLREAARAGASRLRILDLLRRAGGPLGLSELAERTGLHVNTVRFHLERLEADRLVVRETENRSQPGRPRLTFTATPRPDLGPERRSYRLLAEMLAGFFATAVPDVSVEATRIGQVWGGYLTTRPAPYRRATEEEAVAELLRVLEDVGFAPESTEDESGHRILLRQCPFLEVAEAHREVACSVHRGLMQGTLAELRAPLGVDELLPFAEPSGCVAHARRLPPSESAG